MLFGFLFLQLFPSFLCVAFDTSLVGLLDLGLSLGFPLICRLLLATSLFSYLLLTLLLDLFSLGDFCQP